MGHIRVQVVVALLTIALLLVATGYAAFSATTVRVPKAGATYVEGIAGNPHAINPLLCQPNPVDSDLVSLIFTGLTQVSAKGEIVPDLARDWEITRGGTAYTFHLREDVVWHDGAAFTADDVVFTVNTIKDPGFQGVPSLSEVWRTVVVEKVDAHTVRFVLREPFAPFIDYTTMGILPFHILGNASVEALEESRFNANPVGTGPFKVGEVSARRIVLVANDDFYRSRPYLGRLEFIFYPDAPSVFEARGRGEIDGIARVLPQHLEPIRQDDTLNLYSAPLSGYNVVFLNLDRGIFQERGVRQAMMWALDRQALVDDVLEGQGVVIHSPILPWSWAYYAEVQKYAHDPKKAIAALEEAGWFDDDGDGVRERGNLTLEFELATNQDDPTRVALIEAISEQLAAVGIRAVPRTVSWEELVGERLRLRKYDAILSGWQNLPPDPDPYPYWHSSQASEDGLNFANYMSEEADAILAEARATTDKEERVALYRQFQELFARDVPSLLLYQPVYSYAVDVRVNDVQVGPMFDSSDRFRTIDRWYIETERMLYSEAREKNLLPQ
ncbi:MAG: ABC transporter substrate-binding protein [Chloroflexota bacterium]|nr:ABC transporter substrate-binding protein [Chloroflexota bacterium]